MNPLNRVRRGLRAAAVLPVLVAAGAVVLLGSPASAHEDGHQVAIKQYMYMPMDLSIEQGETVTWTNEDSVAHDVTVTAGPTSFHSPMLAEGKSWSHTFAAPGSYSYICSVHPEMKATVKVAAATAVARPSKPAAPATAIAPVVTTAKSTHASTQRGAQAAAAPARPVTSAKQAKTASPTLVTAPQSSATLQPLILVVGTAVAVVLFCLLLMASRAVPLEATASLRLEPKHLEET